MIKKLEEILDKSKDSEINLESFIEKEKESFAKLNQSETTPLEHYVKSWLKRNKDDMLQRFER